MTFEARRGGDTTVITAAAQVLSDLPGTNSNSIEAGPILDGYPFCAE